MRLHLFLATSLLFIACEGTSIPTPKPEIKKEVPAEKKEPKEGPSLPDRIFGLPVPANAFSHFKIGADEAVLVKAKPETLKYFYQKHLVDYEIIEQDKTIFIVGLRSFMSSAKIYPYTNHKKSPLIIKFSPPEREISAEERENLISRKKGTEVKLRTKDGKLVAPGARWGEPYTPPFGTPLHKERYRLNWGRPFGQWKAQ